MSAPHRHGGYPAVGPHGDGAPTPAGPTAPPPSREEERHPADDHSAVGRLAATVERLRGEVRAAHAAAEGRALVELAKGVIVERLGCGPAQAAKQLTELAAQAGLSPLELAADIINQAAHDRVAEVADDFVKAVRHTDGPDADPGADGPAGA
ncbi:ANTAR domain-containing protein, partial [Streptomyces sp. NPDC000963]